MAEIAKKSASGNDKAQQDLKNALKRLGTERTTIIAGQSSPARTGPELIRRVITEIDETILPRRVDIIADDRVVASMVVSHRRLVTLDTGHPAPDGPAGPAPTPPEAPALLGRSVSNTNQSEIFFR